MRKRRRLAGAAGVMLALLLVALLSRDALLRGVAGILVVDQPLQPAAAIVVLGGEAPFRAMEAADLYRQGWAPEVVVSREVDTASVQALMALGIDPPSNWSMSVAALERLGVPGSAIVTPPGRATATRDELAQVYAAVKPAGRPVILVTTKVHSRRAALIWQRVARDGSPGISHPTRYDPFDPSRWWRSRDMLLQVNRELPSLVNELLAYPLRDR